MAEESWMAKGTVIDVLNDSELQKIKAFSFGGIGFDIKTFPILAKYIDKGKIKVEYDSEKDGIAEYDYATNTIIMGFRWFLEATKGGLIAHECTHAVYDVAGSKMSVAVSESIAYIVQSLYVLIKRGPGKRIMSTNAAKDLVFKQAWDIAVNLLNGTPPSSLDQQNLQAAVAQHPLYKKTAPGNAGYNGV